MLCWSEMPRAVVSSFKRLNKLANSESLEREICILWKQMPVAFMLNTMQPDFTNGFLATVTIIGVGEYFNIIKS